MNKYNPDNRNDRQSLASELISMLQTSGFTRDEQPHQYANEEIFVREIGRGISIVVYSTIEYGVARKTGRDAIRVVATYKTRAGAIRGIAKGSKRVNRTGNVDGIVERSLSRMREVYLLAQRGSRCSACKAPKFLSKKGNEVCAELCWK